MTLATAVIAAFNKVYPEDGNVSGPVYYSGALSKVAAFIGIPNRKKRRARQTFLQLLRNFAGLQYNVSPAKKWLNRFLVPFVISFNLVNFVFQFALNLVKVLTEFLPLMLSQYFGQWAEYYYDHHRAHARSRSYVGIRLRIAGTFFLFGLFHLIYFVGRSLTSPIEGVKNAWKLGVHSHKGTGWGISLA